MPRKKTPPVVTEYFAALQQILAMQTSVLTGVLPHAGERGRNDEERFRELLLRLLPRRFSVGTGFLVSSDPSLPESGQTDIIIYDELLNAPLHRELVASIFPVECVYGCVEVKGVLKSSDIAKCLADIAKIRTLASAKRYQVPTTVEVDPKDPKKRVVQHVEVTNELSPRTYVVAYDVKGWANPSTFAAAWRRGLLANRQAHVHGVAVLGRDWFLCQRAYTENDVVLDLYCDNVLARLLGKLLDDISSMGMLPLSLSRYLRLQP